jgi:hypothetical protein
VTDIHAHELAVEIDEAFAFGRPKIDALRARDGNRIDRSLGGPFKQSVAATEFDDLLALNSLSSGCHNAAMLTKSVVIDNVGQDFRIYRIYRILCLHEPHSRTNP